MWQLNNYTNFPVFVFLIDCFTCNLPEGNRNAFLGALYRLPACILYNDFSCVNYMPYILNNNLLALTGIKVSVPALHFKESLYLPHAACPDADVVLLYVANCIRKAALTINIPLPGEPVSGAAILLYFQLVKDQFRANTPTLNQVVYSSLRIHYLYPACQAARWICMLICYMNFHYSNIQLISEIANNYQLFFIINQLFFIFYQLFFIIN